MKLLILALSILYSIHSYALDESVFAEKYPDVKDYQLQCLQGLNLYFFTFLSKSVVFKNPDGQYQIQMQDESGKNIFSLNAKVERSFENGNLKEYVQYILPNGNIFDYYLKKNGLDQTLSSDNDLLTMNFKNQISNYDLAIIPLMTSFHKTGIKDYLALGFLGINISIQTMYKENEALRSYLYFYKEMPNPQSYLSVQVLDRSKSAENLKYIHSSLGAEISPKYFFQALQEGAQIFKAFSQISTRFLKELGFPGIKGIN